jgi:hypothetical protein
VVVVVMMIVIFKYLNLATLSEELLTFSAPRFKWPVSFTGPHLNARIRLVVHAFTKKIISSANKGVEQGNKLHLLKQCLFCHLVWLPYV